MTPRREHVVLVDRTRAEPGDPLTPIVGACLESWIEADRELSARARLRVVQADDGESDAALIRRVLAGRPFLVGFSCYVWNILAVRRVAAALKRAAPRVRVILGGPEVGKIPEKALAACPEADFICLDEGEETLRLLLRHLLLADRPLESVPGLAYRAAQGRIALTQPAELIDLERTASIYLDRKFPVAAGRQALLELSRGCALSCKFCDWRLGKMRYIPLPRIRRELELLVSKKAGHIVLADADILMNKRRGVEILAAFRDAARGTSTVLTFDTNPTFLTDEAIEILASSPENFLLRMGLQSIEPGVLELSERALDLPRVERNVAALRREAPGLPYMFSVIFGLPGDDLDGFKRTLDWAFRMRPVSVIMFHALVLPGAAFYKESEALGIRFQEESPHQILSTPTMSGAELSAARELCYAADLLVMIPSLGEALFSSLPDREKPGAHAEVIERWMEFMRAQGVDLFLGMPVGTIDDCHVHTRVVLAMERLKRDPLSVAVLQAATERFCRSQAARAASASR